MMKSFLNLMPSAEPDAPEAWLLRLRSAHEGGFYRTEAAVGEQVSFPWQGKSCKDCPFWTNDVCRVFAERRSAMAHTCCYFDEANRSGALELLAAHAGQAQHERRGYSGL